MTSIKQLTKTVHSSLRSSVILFDLTKVVEELIFNSIDAGATEINIAISVETCYVKVDDDGCGVNRDGLVLLGERYATSKLKRLAEMDTSTENFGFRGESLGSLSDIALLEITTKAQGRPNGYRKIIKGCKCLYLGIDDTRQEFGTTVIVRDLFYNQPVRRKHMNSSPKKVLYSVKKCVLRVALVRPQISFRVTDMESGSQVLHTHPSPSPLPLVSSAFGVDISRSLSQVSYSRGVLELSGFLSGPDDSFSTKAFQNVYINSRFVGKGPIHKLLNNIASTSKCSELWNGISKSPNEKRTQAYPAYLLNLLCPRSCYDLTFEPSKTTVEFKDWVPILSFVEQAIGQIWKRTPVQGEFIKREGDGLGKDELRREKCDFISPIQDVSRDSEVGKKKRKFQHNQSFGHLTIPSFSPAIASEGSDHPFQAKKHMRLSGELCKSSKEVTAQPTKTGYNHQTNCSFQDTFTTPWDVQGFISKVVSPERSIQLWFSDNGQFSIEKDLPSSELTARAISEEDMNGGIFGSGWGNGFIEVNDKGSRQILRTSGHFDYSREALYSPGSSEGFKKPFLRSCSLRRSCGGAFFSNGKGFEVEDNFSAHIEQLGAVEKVNVGEANDNDRHSEFSPKTYFQDSFATCPSTILTKCHMMAGLDFMPSDFTKPHGEEKVRCGGEGELLNNPVKQFEKRANDLSTNSEWSLLSPYPISGTVASKVDHFTEEYAPENSFLLHSSESLGKFTDKKGRFGFLPYATVQNNSSVEEYPADCYTNNGLNFDYHFSPKKCLYDRFDGTWSNEIMVPEVESSNKLALGMDSLCMYSSGIGIKSCGVPDMQVFSPRYHKDGKSRNKKDSPNRVCEKRPLRSHSAPPFSKGKKRFSTIYSYAINKAGGESDFPNLPAPHFEQFSESCGVSGKNRELTPDQDSTASPVSDFGPFSQSFGVSEKHRETAPARDSFLYSRTSVENNPPSMGTMNAIHVSEDLKKSHCHQLFSPDPVKDLSSNELDDLELSRMKWRNGNPHIADGDRSYDFHDQSDILDISSGILHLSGGSVVPESINKDCLEDAKVLLQLDKKFIPVVAGVTLSVIDQHAADERIRLEELRQKVLSGEGKTVAYLDSEHELVLPEIAYQLLQNYSVQIQAWGWICNINSHGSGSFRKNLNLLHKRTTSVTLVAVPCILGVKLSDKDLLEFLEQLAETDGSSTMPPSVVRVLNFKACRGAIMFGDALLPSECSLIVEELKQTSLCFQCAHGRPTTVPLVNLTALHKQLSNLESYNGRRDEAWHGLHRHRPSLQRARERLISAGGQ